MLVLGAELAQRLSFYRASGIKYPQSVSSYLWSCE
jgi:hypothetical protein